MGDKCASTEGSSRLSWKILNLELILINFAIEQVFLFQAVIFRSNLAIFSDISCCFFPQFEEEKALRVMALN